MRLVLIFIFILSTCACIVAQGIGFGTSSPDSSAVLDIQSSNKGVLIPRIALSSVTVADLVTDPVDGLLIYNTTYESSGNDQIYPGYYFWKSGSERWVPIRTLDEDNIGFGTWGDCADDKNLSNYHPVVASDGASQDSFGFSVAMEGEFAFIGAPYDDIGDNVDQGSVYVFKYDGLHWNQVQKLTANDGSGGDLFGYSISISEEWLAIGAPYSDTGGPDRGSAYLFLLENGEWNFQLKKSGTETNGFFGYSVCLMDTILAVGSPGSSNQFGAVKTFIYNGSAWLDGQTLTIGGYGPGWFGNSIAMSDTFAIIGAFKSSISYPEIGVVYIFKITGSSFTEAQVLFVPDDLQEEFDRFGNSISISGQYTYVGCARDDHGPSHPDRGTIFRYILSEGSWTDNNYLSHSQPNDGDLFGYSVSCEGENLLVGTPRDDIDSITDNGSAFIYYYSSQTESLVIIPPSLIAFQEFGRATALSGRHFLISAPGLAKGRGAAIFGKF